MSYQGPKYVTSVKAKTVRADGRVDVLFTTDTTDTLSVGTPLFSNDTEYVAWYNTEEMRRDEMRQALEVIPDG